METETTTAPQPPRAIRPTKLVRRFTYNGMVLEDPDPTLPPAKAVEVLSASFPALVNAKIEPPKVDGGVQTYAVTVRAETRG